MPHFCATLCGTSNIISHCATLLCYTLWHINQYLSLCHTFVPHFVAHISISLIVPHFCGLLIGSSIQVANKQQLMDTISSSSDREIIWVVGVKGNESKTWFQEYLETSYGYVRVVRLDLKMKTANLLHVRRGRRQVSWVC